MTRQFQFIKEILQRAHLFPVLHFYAGLWGQKCAKPLYVANEGKLLLIAAPEDTERALATLRQNALGARAAVIAEVSSLTPAQVLVRSPLGGLRVLEEPTGAPLPRIC